MKRFYEFKQNEEKETTDLYVYGDITSLEWFKSDVSAFSFKEELANVNNDLSVHINSYGGDVSEGLAMYSLLRDFAKDHKVTTICDGFACSAASVIFMAGDERVMSEAGLLLIHNAWTYACGDANELRKTAEDLEKITQPSLNVYVSRTGLSEESIKEMMDDETWITAQEAIEMGFATSIEKTEAQQSINEHFLAHQVTVNKALEGRVKELEEALAEATKDPDPTGWAKFFN